MGAGIFEDCVFFLKVNHLSAQDKKHLKTCIKDNGGMISFVLNKKCTHVITENADSLSSRHLQIIRKNLLPVLGVDFVLNLSSKPTNSSEIVPEKINHSFKMITKKETCNQDEEPKRTKEVKAAEKETLKPEKKRTVFIECDPDDANLCQDFEVAKYAALEKLLAGVPSQFGVIELQCLRGDFDLPYQISVHLGLSNGVKSKLNYLQFETSEEACERYHICVEDLRKKGFKLRDDIPREAVHLTSEKLQELIIQDAINATSVAAEISSFVELIWVEALGHLEHILRSPVNSFSLNDVSRAEGILLQVRTALDKGENVASIIPVMSEFYRIIPHKGGSDYDINKKLLSSKQSLCQVIRDIVSVCEANMSNPNPPSLAKYHALRCMIQHVNPSSDEYLQVKEQVLQRNYSDNPLSILNIYRVGRINEAVEFESNLVNVTSLLHASAACHYVGILSRGLLLPKVVVEDHGVERTDIGNLGSGIYFSDSISTSMKYSAPTQNDGSRLLVVCDVALGNCFDAHRKDFSLTSAPSGYDSVHGIRKEPGVFADFEDDEYVVYRSTQVKMKYIVQFCLAEDNITEFCPEVNIAELEESLPNSPDLHLDETDLVDIKPLDEMKSGLLDSFGNPIPLEGVHMKGKILDLFAQVVVFQTYTNASKVPIEAKYVFPLDGNAAVCGFEAFINGKHIIGEVKEKKEAHREYREAVSQGHGAYLMDQDMPDVFTVSVGNLPPKATVLIKITYVTELVMEYGLVKFTLPVAVAPCQEDKALKENTQDTVDKICVKEDDVKNCAFSLALSIEMPFKIENINCWTHKIKTKQTDCKAVVRTANDSTISSSDFILYITLADSELPRMWVEKHPDKESEACMLLFKPDFDAVEYINFDEAVICLDCSNSMSPVLQQAKMIAVHLARTFFDYKKLRIIKFGTSYEEVCSYSKPVVNFELVETFIKSAKPTMGNTDFWKPLHYLSLLPPSKGVRSIVLISDGHIQDETRTFQIIKNNVKHTRLFTCGVGSTANRHILRSLAKYGAGAYEFFDEKSKYSWLKKVNEQITKMRSEGCHCVSVKWQQFNADAPVPIQAPAHIQSVFESERVLVYGFVPHCTQASLRALIGNQEVDTMVSTTELQKTTGTILHRLTARALIRDYEDGILHEKENEHELKKRLLKSKIIDLSKEYSIVTQFTSFVAIEPRDTNESQADVPDIQKIIDAEDIDILPYMTWETEFDEETVEDGSQHSAASSDSVENMETDVTLEDYLTDIMALEPSRRRPSSRSSRNRGSAGNYQELPGTTAMAPASPLNKTKGEALDSETDMLYSLFLEEADLVMFSDDISCEAFELKPSLPRTMPQSHDGIMKRIHRRTSSISRMGSAPSYPGSLSQQPEPSVLNIALPAPLPPQPPPPAPQFARPIPPPKPLALFGLLPPSASPLVLPQYQFLQFSPTVEATKQQVCSYETFYDQSPLDGTPPPSFSRRIAMKQMKQITALSDAPPGFTTGLFGSAASDFRRLRMAKAFVSSDALPSDQSAGFGAASSGFGFGTYSFEKPQMAKAFVSSNALPSDQSAGFGAASSGFGFGTYSFEKPQVAQSPILSWKLKQVEAYHNWVHLFLLQTPDHYWELDEKLEIALKVNVSFLIDVFLAQKGLNSLGPKAKEAVLRLIATLLVLQVMRQVEKHSGIIFKLLMKLDESSVKTDNYWLLHGAIEWARNVDKQYPGICCRLGLGSNWDLATRQLLGIDPIEDTSPLRKAVYNC
ncbi:protein mono-ADP-ribosyltransferase PARP4 isoform X2 [Ambystoma mexicanum]|uniref:protein mono-ADP-ribosyltransferase PARP4 isoform X2 n=1 Tax=Ambystoma mexicanum TaxID=8296 RepID=UPI0037E95E72